MATILGPRQHFCQGTPANCGQCSTVGPGLVRKKVLFCCNNTATILALSARTARDPAIKHLLRCLFFLQPHFKFDYEAKHISGKENGSQLLCPAIVYLPLSFSTGPSAPSRNPLHSTGAPLYGGPEGHPLRTFPHEGSPHGGYSHKGSPRERSLMKVPLAKVPLPKVPAQTFSS